jgi:hypothetical protein
MADVNVLIVDTTIYAGQPLLSFQPPKPGLTVSTPGASIRRSTASWVGVHRPPGI